MEMTLQLYSNDDEDYDDNVYDNNGYEDDYCNHFSRYYDDTGNINSLTPMDI